MNIIEDDDLKYDYNKIFRTPKEIEALNYILDIFLVIKDSIKDCNIFNVPEEIDTCIDTLSKYRMILERYESFVGQDIDREVDIKANFLFTLEHALDMLTLDDEHRAQPLDSNSIRFITGGLYEAILMLIDFSISHLEEQKRMMLELFREEEEELSHS